MRLGAIFVALFFLKDASFIDLPVLGFALVLTHLALLFWETKHLSISLAAPGLKPAAPGDLGRGMNRLLALEFPPISHLTIWRDLGARDQQDRS